MKNLNVLKWLIALADGKPIIFAVAILLIAVTTMGTVIINRDTRLHDCIKEQSEIVKIYEKKIEDLDKANEDKIANLNLELKETLLLMIEESKIALEEQKNLNQKINTTINKTSNLIKNNKKKLKNLK